LSNVFEHHPLLRYFVDSSFIPAQDANNCRTGFVHPKQEHPSLVLLSKQGATSCHHLAA